MTIIRFRTESALCTALAGVDPFQVLGRPCFARKPSFFCGAWA